LPGGGHFQEAADLRVGVQQPLDAAAEVVVAAAGVGQVGLARRPGGSFERGE
jgi:hypothetical protein